MRRGVTVLELLIVVIIIVVIVIVLLPAHNNVRRAAYRASCANNLKRFGQAAHHYRDTHGHFPPGTAPGTPLPPEQRLSFHALLLPDLDQMKPVNGTLKLTEPWDSQANQTALKDTNWGQFQCQEWYDGIPYEVQRQRPGWPKGYPLHTNFVGIAGIGADAATRPADSPGIGMWGYDRTLKTEQVKDGLSNTILLIETGHEVGTWTRGGPTTVRPIDPAAERLVGADLPFGGTHYHEPVFGPNVANGFVTLLTDGSTRFTKRAVSPGVLIALATVAGDEVVPTDW